ncbi:MAG: hypothetical protein ACRENW_02825 [Thermodesulfobacteriota bacterium]
MNQPVFIVFLVMFSLSFFNIPLSMSTEKNHSDILLKEEIMNKDGNLGIFAEYKKAQEELWEDYQKIRDEFINGYLAKKLQMTYEEFNGIEKSLRDKYIERRRVLLEMYFRESAISNQRSAISNR